MLQIGNTLKFYQIFFLGKYASKEKRSVKYCLIFSEFCCHKGGRIPLTAKLRGLVPYLVLLPLSSLNTQGKALNGVKDFKANIN